MPRHVPLTTLWAARLAVCSCPARQAGAVPEAGGYTELLPRLQGWTQHLARSGCCDVCG